MMDLQTATDSAIAVACSQHSEVLAVYRFGSTAAGPRHPLSDLDIAVLLSPGNLSDYLRLEEALQNELCRILHREDVDLLILNKAPIALRFRVITEGVCLYSPDEQDRVDFETAVLYRYFDLKPALDLLASLHREGLQVV